MRGHHILAAALLLALAGCAAALTLEPGVYTIKLQAPFRRACPNRDFLTTYGCTKGNGVFVLPLPKGGDASQWWSLSRGFETELERRPIQIRNFGRIAEGNELCATRLRTPAGCSASPFTMSTSTAATSNFVFEATREPTGDYVGWNRFYIRTASRNENTCALNYLGMHASSCDATQISAFSKFDKNAELVWVVDPAAPYAPTILSAAYNGATRNLDVMVQPPTLTGWGALTSIKVKLSEDGSTVGTYTCRKQGSGNYACTIPSADYEAGTTYAVVATASNAKKTSADSAPATIGTCANAPVISSAGTVGSVMGSEPQGDLVVFVNVDSGADVKSYSVYATSADAADLAPKIQALGTLVNGQRRFSWPSSAYARGVTYDFTVVAHTATCDSDPSESYPVEVAAYVPDAPKMGPATVELKGADRTLKVVVTLPKNIGSGSLTSVRVQAIDTNGRMMEVDTADFVPAKFPTVTTTAGVSTVTISFPKNAHKAGTNYVFLGFVSSRFGESEESTHYSYRTPDVPATPAIRDVSYAGEGEGGQVTVVCSVPLSGGSPIVNYTAICENAWGEVVSVTGPGVSVPTSKRAIKFPVGAIHFDKEYECACAAVNVQGASKLSAPMAFSMERPWLPQAPASCELAANPDSLSLHRHWDGSAWIVYTRSSGAAIAKLAVQKFWQGQWRQVGQASFGPSGAIASVPKLAFHPLDGSAYVAFADRLVGEVELIDNSYLSLMYLDEEEDTQNGAYFAGKWKWTPCPEQAAELDDRWCGHRITEGGDTAQRRRSLLQSRGAPFDINSPTGAFVRGDSISPVWVQYYGDSKWYSILFIAFDFNAVSEDFAMGIGMVIYAPPDTFFGSTYGMYIGSPLDINDIEPTYLWRTASGVSLASSPVDEEGNGGDILYLSAAIYGAIITTGGNPPINVPAPTTNVITVFMPMSGLDFSGTTGFSLGGNFDVKVLGGLRNRIQLDSSSVASDQISTKLVITPDNKLMLAINDPDRNGLSVHKFKGVLPEYETFMESPDNYPYNSMERFETTYGQLPEWAKDSVEHFDLAFTEDSQPLLAVQVADEDGHAHGHVLRYNGEEWVRECAGIFSETADSPHILSGPAPFLRTGPKATDVSSPTVLLAFQDSAGDCNGLRMATCSAPVPTIPEQ